jgi:hypothetical protein
LLGKLLALNMPRLTGDDEQTEAEYRLLYDPAWFRLAWIQSIEDDLSVFERERE